MRHLGTIKTSKAQQRVLQTLSDGNYYTSFELCLKAEVTNPSGVISELRAQGFHIITEYVGESERGARVWRYRWLNPIRQGVAA
jgi:ribosomal protein S8